MFAKITAATHACPSHIVSNDQLSTIMDTSDEWIFSRTGIKNRHISTGEDTSDLAIKVAQKLLDQKGLDASELDFIIVATITPDSQMPSVAARVQAAIGAERAFAYDLVAACSGFVFALSTAEKLILAGQQKGLVIGAEVFSKILDWSDRSTAVLFGDGAGGVLLENASSTPFVIAEELRTDGSRGDKLTSGATGVHSPFAQVDGPKASIQMDGRAIFDFATRDVPKNMLSVLTKAQLAVEEVDYFLLHQANSRILDKMAKKIGADRHKFLQNMAEYGNTSAASIPILLSESIESGKLSLGIKQKIILSGFGGGLTWGTMLIQL